MLCFLSVLILRLDWVVWSLCGIYVGVKWKVLGEQRNLILERVFAASPQGVSSLLGNNFSTSPSAGMQGQLHSANGHVGGMSPSSVGNGNDGVAFDINDFPQLTTRQSSSGNMQGTAAMSCLCVSFLHLYFPLLWLH